MSTLTPPVGTPVPVDIPHLHRVRNGVRAVLALGVAASVAGNVLHAQPTLVGRAIAAWSPLALLLAVELISRVPVHKLILSILRMLSTAGIAGIAAWVSYGHMVSVAQRHGENSTSAHLLPLSVDGLVVVASVSLVEIAARLRQATAATSAVGQEAPAGEAAESAPQASVPVPPPGYQVHPDARVEPVPAVDAVDPADEGEIGEVPAPRPAPRMDPLPAPAQPAAEEAPSDDASEGAPEAAVPAPGYQVHLDEARAMLAAAVADVDPIEDEIGEVPAPRPAPRLARPVVGRPAGRPTGRSTAVAVTRLRAKHPQWTVGQIAEKAGCSVRTARRHLNPAPPATGPQVGSDDAAAA
jgi:hypothetical protein